MSWADEASSQDGHSTAQRAAAPQGMVGACLPRRPRHPIARNPQTRLSLNPIQSGKTHRFRICRRRNRLRRPRISQVFEALPELAHPALADEGGDVAVGDLGADLEWDGLRGRFRLRLSNVLVSGSGVRFYLPTPHASVLGVARRDRDRGGTLAGRLAYPQRHDRRDRAWLDPSAGTRVIDPTGKMVLPGGIDPHVHLRPVRSASTPEGADDYTSASRAAFAGGVTTIGNFINHSRERTPPYNRWHK